ncbi:MAG: hypothetical protein HDT47_01295 [Ruminococcaceae bacterium]|nr:hypothetical protein [Oscillospiraceae bacterium]
MSDKDLYKSIITIMGLAKLFGRSEIDILHEMLIVKQNVKPLPPKEAKTEIELGYYQTISGLSFTDIDWLFKYFEKQSEIKQAERVKGTKICDKCGQKTFDIDTLAAEDVDNAPLGEIKLISLRKYEITKEMAKKYEEILENGDTIKLIPYGNRIKAVRTTEEEI